MAPLLDENVIPTMLLLRPQDRSVAVRETEAARLVQQVQGAIGSFARHQGWPLLPGIAVISSCMVASGWYLHSRGGASGTTDERPSLRLGRAPAGVAVTRRAIPGSFGRRWEYCGPWPVPLPGGAQFILNG